MIVELFLIVITMTPVFYLVWWGLNNNKIEQYHSDFKRFARKCCNKERDLLQLMKEK